MKRSIRLYALLATAAMAGACTKEVIESSAVSREVPASLEVSINDSTKLTIAYDSDLKKNVFSWNSGDNVAICQYNKKGTINTSISTFTTTDSGNSARFIGSVYDPVAGSAWYALFPATAVTDFQRLYGRHSIDFPETQTGLASDLRNCYIMGIGGLDAAESPSGQTSGTELESIAFSTSKKPTPLTPLLKLNLPSACNVTSIEFKAYDSSDQELNIAGKFTNYFRLNQDYNEAVPKGKAVEAKKYIIIEREGAVIDGDVYISILPDLGVSGKLSTQNLVVASSATKLSFKFSDAKGNYANVTGTINDGTATKPALTNQKLFNFGNVPAGLMMDFNCKAPKALTYNSYSGADGNYKVSAKDMIFSIPTDKTLADITYGVEYSVNGGSTWTAVTATGGIETDGKVTFDADITATLKFTDSLYVRSFAYLTAKPGIGGNSPTIQKAVAGDSFIYINFADPFHETMQGSATETYEDKEFILKGCGRITKANGPLYITSSLLYIQKGGTLSVPVIPGKVLSAVVTNISNTQKALTVNKNDTEKTTILTINNKISSIDCSKTGLLGYIPEDEMSDNLLISSNQLEGSTYYSRIKDILLIYTTTDPKAKNVTSVDPVKILDDGAYVDFYYEGGEVSDYTVGAEYSTNGGTSWTTVTSTLSSAVTGGARFKLDSALPALSTVRGFAYPTTTPATIIKGSSQTVPDYQLVFDFTGGHSTFAASSTSFDSGRTGIDFSTGDAEIAKSATYPKTTFDLSNGTVTCPVNIWTGSQSGKRSYAFKLDSSLGLCSYKLRLYIQGIEGKQVVSMYSKNGEAKKAFTLLEIPKSTNQQYVTAFYDCYKVTTLAAGGTIQYGSDSNTEETRKIIINFINATE